MFTPARQAEIIRSNQKDEYYMSYIKSSVADICQRFLGPRTWLRWRKELDLAGDLGYFLLTTFAGFQTLGEEYVNMIQVDDTLRTVPAILRRTSMILLQVAAPYVIDRVLTEVEKRLRINTEISLTPEARSAILGAIPVLRHTLTLIHRCHLALFYLYGVFYHLAKRLTGVHYILVRDSGSIAGSSYRVLGWLSVIQLSIAFLQQAYKWSHQQRVARDDVAQARKQVVGKVEDVYKKRTVSVETDVALDPRLKCSLCLENRTDSTLTPCGHLFCWGCISEWCATKPECPLCREVFQMSRLVVLQNYDPS